MEKPNSCSWCRETDVGKLREVCRKAIRDCQEQKATTNRLESRIMRLERDKEVLGWPVTILFALTGLRMHHRLFGSCWPGLACACWGL